MQRTLHGTLSRFRDNRFRGSFERQLSLVIDGYVENGEFSDVWGNLEEARGEFGKKKKREKNSVEWNEDNEPE